MAPGGARGSRARRSLTGGHGPETGTRRGDSMENRSECWSWWQPAPSFPGASRVTSTRSTSTSSASSSWSSVRWACCGDLSPPPPRRGGEETECRKVTGDVGGDDERRRRRSALAWRDRRRPRAPSGLRSRGRVELGGHEHGGHGRHQVSSGFIRYSSKPSSMRSDEPGTTGSFSRTTPVPSGTYPRFT